MQLNQPAMRTALQRFIFVFSCLLVFTHVMITDACSQSVGPRKDYKLISGRSYVQSKNYYLLTLFESLPAVRNMLKKDPVLNGIARVKSDSVRNALKYCGREGLCYTSRLKFSDEEIKMVSDRLTDLYKPGNEFGKLVDQHLIPSGCYILFQNLTPKEMLVKAWEQDAKGINFCIGVYAEGKKANYPLIDSIGFVTRNPRDTNSFSNGYLGLLYNTTSLLSLQVVDTAVFYQAPMLAALQFLEINERDQAADFEPMAAGENRDAVNRIKTTNWAKYKYSVILVPGAGPEDPKVPLSAEGMLRCRLAAIQYQKGLAPFIVVSGGKVHPYKTKYCEATEMKQFLVEKMGVPASAIIIDPHARHTTTNMRNTVRLIYRYGIPFNKPGITCTTRGQSTMIGTTLIARCQRELDMAPYKNGERLSETEIEFFALIEALHIDPTEPMDP